MKSIKIEEWGGYRFYFDPKEVGNAEKDAEVLECLRHQNGNKPYSPMRCAVLAGKPEGKKLANEIRRVCEGGRDKGKGKAGRRPIEEDTDSGMGR